MLGLGSDVRRGLRAYPALRGRSDLGAQHRPRDGRAGVRGRAARWTACLRAEMGREGCPEEGWPHRSRHRTA
jgi:hypothetical protein